MTAGSPRVCLVCMPWHDVSRPSLQLGVLASACVAHGVDRPLAYHGGLRFAEFLLRQSDGALGPYDYTAIAEEGFPHALGDWVFAGALNGDGYGAEGMRQYAARRGLSLTKASKMRELADAFCDLVVDELIALDPQVVGFSTTFMQNVPSLAVARRLKQRRGDITVLFGGGNCDGEMGVALHREFDFVDLVLRGEADETLPLLLRTLAADDGAGDLASVPGLCWRDEHGTPHANRQPVRLVSPVHMAAPDFDDWFGAFDASPVSAYVEPELVMESARGCWWGEHHHCTFCGLNGTTMAFRAKRPETFLAELEHLVTRHKVLDVTVVDNILEPQYLRDVLPQVSGLGWDMRLHYEVKANLTSEQIGVLRAAGVYSVQPGIESLVDDVLHRMDKGVPAARNVRTLRDCQSAGLTVAWNWLYGFPGERVADYLSLVAQLPALVHLQPPNSVARIQLNRFSPHFEDPSLGFSTREPAEPYRYVYDLPPERMHDLVYLFDTPPSGLTEEQVEPLRTAAEEWARDHAISSLRRFEVDGVFVLEDRRAGWQPADHTLEDPREQRAWLELEYGRTPTGLLRRLEEAGVPWDPDELFRWLHGLRERGLVFVEGDRWVGLTTTSIRGPSDQVDLSVPLPWPVPAP
nr:RiPP maturation radical SAM C-methyltransferase [Actinoallomurus iriomotensis]